MVNAVKLQGYRHGIFTEMIYKSIRDYMEQTGGSGSGYPGRPHGPQGYAPQEKGATGVR